VTPLGAVLVGVVVFCVLWQLSAATGPKTKKQRRSAVMPVALRAPRGTRKPLYCMCHGARKDSEQDRRVHPHRHGVRYWHGRTTPYWQKYRSG
jgi:hypothetical protein